MYIKEPKFITLAKEESKGRNILVEVLTTILLFIMASVVSGFLMGIIFRSIIGKNNYSQEAINFLNLLSFFGVGGVFVLYARFIQGRSLESMGFLKEDLLKEYGKGLGLGFLMLALAWLITIIIGANKLTGLNPNIRLGALLLLFLGFIIQGMAEEIIFRGFLMVNIARRYGSRIGILISSILFAALHLLNPGINFLALLNIFLVGIVFSLYMIKRENIWAVGAAHTMWNFAQGNIFGVAVSGMDLDESLLITEKIGENNFLNGGVFGIEGSLAGTLILVLAIIVIYRSLYKEKDLI